MDELIGPLSDGKVVLQISALLGVFLAAVAWSIINLTGVAVSSAQQSYIVIAGFVLGVGLVFIGHTVWHYRRAKTNN